MIVLDASVVISYFAHGDSCHARAVELLDAHADEFWGISPITLAEMLVFRVKAGDADEFQRALDALDVHTIPLDSFAPRRLAEIRALTGSKLPDCCVLLAAETTGGQIATFDERLRKSAEQLALALV